MKLRVLLYSALFCAFPAIAEIAVVVHPSNAAALDKEATARLFLAKSRSFGDSGIAIILSQKAENTAAREFNEKVLAKSASQLKAYWSQLVFTGKGSPPTEVMSDAEMLKLVASNPSMIGYVDAKAVNDSVRIVGKF